MDGRKERIDKGDKENSLACLIVRIKTGGGGGHGNKGTLKVSE